ncbi:enhanced intracellular survival protein Eis [Cohnella sp. CFH 77786]|uniref:GNAT family N-acetyltransferase n=1 Tax=Cohnella sp. CFH 77786 TaxID=2662265 RepID=UPI001C609C0D|nr:GNAT family N-acetyltransferase [Cohnella sp. CFH 77786]
MAEIRQLKAEEFDERMKLSQFAFQFQIPAEQMEKRRAAFHPDRHYGLFDEDGRLLSALLLIPYEAWVRGRKLKMGGVAAVASWPDARRQGGVTRLLTHSFETMRRQGQSLSMLHPFSFPFYRKYGYEMTIERKRYTLDLKHLPPRRETPGTVQIVDKDIGLLNPVYEAYASRYDSTIVRTEEWWNNQVLSKPGLAAVYFDEAGRAQGYVLYEVADKSMNVHEWIALTDEARVALWSYAANHDSMIERLKVTVPADDALPFLVPDPRFKQELEPYFMSRIVDAEAFVAQYSFLRTGEAMEIDLTVEDAYAPWNDGAFRLRVDGAGAGMLEKLPEGVSPAAAGGVRCDIAALAALLVGGRKAGWLLEIGRLNGSREAAEALERVVPGQRPYLADFF